MKLWLDAQLSSHLAPWISKKFNVEAYSLEYLELDAAEDEEIFSAARATNAAVLTKDEDFVELQARLGAPPKLVWITCGNTSNAYLRKILQKILSETLVDALNALAAGSSLVEISDAVKPNR